jgi:hypothetical protein
MRLSGTKRRPRMVRKSVRVMEDGEGRRPCYDLDSDKTVDDNITTI